MKICSTEGCKIEIAKGSFCKKCNNSRWYQKNLEYRKDKNNQYRKNSNNKVKHLLTKWYSNEGIKYHREYRKTNAKKIAVQKQNRYQNNIQLKLKDRLRSRLYHAIKNQQKVGNAIDDLGCNIFTLKLKLQLKFTRHPKSNEYMSWDNYGRNGWEIDHIKPLSSFDLTNHEELKKACHYSNLQPLWIKENRRKGNRCD